MEVNTEYVAIFSKERPAGPTAARRSRGVVRGEA